MIKFFCDRCGSELTEYEYNNSCTTISKAVAFDEQYSYKLCGFCTAQFTKFLSGEEVKRVEKVKD
jgi:hypothetical protein